MGPGGPAFMGDIPPWHTEQRFWEIVGGLRSKITSLHRACGMEEGASVG